MGRYVVRDPATREFEIDESALPFWEHREGYTVRPAKRADDKPAADDAPSGAAHPASGEPTPPEETGKPVEGNLAKPPTSRKTSTNNDKIEDK